MTIEEQNKILKNALSKMGNFIRNNPPLDLNAFNDLQLMSILAGGLERDPQGKEYVHYFINKAIKEENKGDI